MKTVRLKDVFVFSGMDPAHPPEEVRKKMAGNFKSFLAKNQLTHAMVAKKIYVIEDGKLPNKRVQACMVCHGQYGVDKMEEAAIKCGLCPLELLKGIPVLEEAAMRCNYSPSAEEESKELDSVIISWIEEHGVLHISPRTTGEISLNKHFLKVLFELSKAWVLQKQRELDNQSTVTSPLTIEHKQWLSDVEKDVVSSLDLDVKLLLVADLRQKVISFLRGLSDNLTFYDSVFLFRQCPSCNVEIYSSRAKFCDACGTKLS